MADLNKILDASVAADGFHIPQGKSGHGVIDLTTIDSRPWRNVLESPKPRISTWSN